MMCSTLDETCSIICLMESYQYLLLENKMYCKKRSENKTTYKCIKSVDPRFHQTCHFENDIMKLSCDDVIRKGTVIAQWIQLRLTFGVLGSNPKQTIYAFSRYLTTLRQTAFSANFGWIKKSS